jgi:acyl-CoA synthetase (AMP-forming)/AMP-acid ligase II
MLYEHFKSPALPDSVAVVTEESETSWKQLASLVDRRYAELTDVAGCRVGLPLPASADGLATLAALDGHRCSVFLLDARLSDAQIDGLISDLALDCLVRLPADSANASSVRTLDDSSGKSAASSQTSPQSSVTILTSGTEGRPKAARHTWETLAKPVRRYQVEDREVEPQRWLLTYRVQLYAGLQVTLQALLNYGTLVMPRPGASPDAVVALMNKAKVEFASATPSYWRRLVLFANRQGLSEVPLQQITLGGEAVDQQILDGLSDVYPECRIVHIYATTELGRCFSVSDGKAGFPTTYLAQDDSQSNRRRAELKIENGELWVRSSNRMQGYDSATQATATTDEHGWYATGDLVEQRDDRVFFLGRAGEMINVGGNKVQPFMVENCVRAVEGVADVRVFAKSSSIAGQLVACEFVTAEGFDPDEIRQAIAEACLTSLAGYQRPRFIQHVDQIRLSSAGKSQRIES